jgi:aminocarboxymuconate-semialdehyde decarboxylase
VRPAFPAGKERMRDYELTVVVGYLFDNTINILKMICSGFPDRWPVLKLVCAHTVAFNLILRSRMQRKADTNAQLSATLKAPVGQHLCGLYFEEFLERWPHRAFVQQLRL